MSKAQFYPIRVKEVKRETPSAVSVAFQIPSELKDTFKYQAGQYITLKHTIRGEEVRRSYSICSSPLEDDFRVAIKQVQHGIFSTFANTELKANDTLEVMPPMGHFTLPLDEKNHKNYVAIAAGSGITPILSLIKTILASEPHSTFTLIFSNRNLQSIMFREEIEGLKNKHMGRLQLTHILSKERLENDLNFGRINKDKCKQIFTKLIDLKKVDEFLLCGPEEMIMTTKEYLEEQHVDSKKIHFELFTVAGTAKAQQAYKESHKADADKVSMVTIKVDERSMEIPLTFGGDTILDAALKNGADLPFACKGGVCCTCKAKLIEGTVDMVVNYALDEDEVKQGFILTCQAHPTSEKVVIDFDVR